MGKKMNDAMKNIFLAGTAALMAASFASCSSSSDPPLLPGMTFGGAGSDSGRSIQQTSDGGFIIAGSTNSLGAGGIDVYLVKTGPTGTLLWEVTFGGPGDDHGHSVQQTSDGGFIIAGYTNSLGAGGNDVYLVKTGPSGTLLWETTFGGPGEDYGYSIQQTADGYVVAGTHPGADGEPDAYLVKTDLLGNILWERTFGGPIAHPGGSVNNWAVEGLSVQQTADGGYIVAGRAESLLVAADIPFLGLYGFDVYLVKTDPEGNKLWETTFGGAGDQRGNSVRQTSDGGFIVAGTSELAGAIVSAYLVKTDAFGEPSWDETFGAGGPDAANSVRQTADGGYIVAGVNGANSGDVYLIKTDASGNPVWERTFGASGADSASEVLQTPDGGYVVAGSTTSAGAGGSDGYFLRTDANSNEFIGP